MRYTFALIIILLYLTACSPTPTPSTPVSLEEATQPIPDITQAVTASSDDVIPTLRPTEVLATPATLDRQFEDSAEMQRQREELVTTFIEPVVEDETVLAAMRAVPRHSFIPTGEMLLAYNDHPLPIGYGQTISQPSLVAMMTELLQLEAGDSVLEIGTGSGYQAAILAEITDEVYTVEIIPELTSIARAVLSELDYDSIQIDRRDGYFGWEEYAPFDAIIVTAAPDHLPQPLVRQLSPEGGRMVIPIGPVGNVQMLWLVTRNGEDISMEQLLPVRFVPFTREEE